MDDIIYQTQGKLDKWKVNILNKYMKEEKEENASVL